MKLRQRPITTIALTGGLMAVGALGGVGTAGAAKRMEVALQDEPVFLQQAYGNRDRALRQARDLQVTRLRANVQWAKVLGSRARSRSVPSRLTYDWAQYDSLINAAAAYGIRVEFALTGPAPAWATANRHVGPFKPNARRYASFVEAAAKHFEGRVDRYLIWNEPNYIGWLAPLSRGPRLYRSLYKAGYRAIRRVDPRAEVLIGVTSPYAIRKRATAPLAFLRGVTCVSSNYRRRSCGGLVADGYAHHPYDFTSPIRGPERTYPPRSCTRLSKRAQRLKCPDAEDSATLGTLSRLTRALTKLARVRALRSSRGRPLNLYLTEYGYFAIGKRRIAESRRAVYLRRAFAMAQRNRRVKQLLQYGLIQPPRGYIGSFFDLSIATRDGRPRKTFRTLGSWARTAAARGQVKRPEGPISLPPAPPG